MCLHIKAFDNVDHKRFENWKIILKSCYSEAQEFGNIHIAVLDNVNHNYIEKGKIIL